MEFKARIGQFLAVVGVFILVVFCATDQAQNPAYSFFCAGILLFLSGAVLIIHQRPRPAPSQRFRLLRRERNDKSKKGAG